jgi:site-specific recombinase XerD
LLDRFFTERAILCADQVGSDAIEEFLSSRPRKRPQSYNHLLGVVRRLFDWLVQQDLLESSPVKAVTHRQTGQRIPFIFDRCTASRLLELAAGLRDSPRASMRGATYHTIFAVLYGLGLRVGEAARLRVDDIDWDRNLLLIRETKFYKSRLVPFGPRIQQLLRDYVEAKRVHRVWTSSGDPLFTFSGDRIIPTGTIRQAFRAMLPKLSLQVPPGVGTPRVHDLRHSFAIGTLLRWYRSGQDPSARLLHLSTFLGHVDVSSTAVYLIMTPALLDEANRRFEGRAMKLLGEGLLP